MDNALPRTPRSNNGDTVGSTILELNSELEYLLKWRENLQSMLEDVTKRIQSIEKKERNKKIIR